MGKTFFLLLVLPLLVFASQKSLLWLKGAVGKRAHIFVDLKQEGAAIIPSLWANLAQGGEAPRDLIGENQAAIARLKPEYIRVDHIFDYFVKKTPNGFDFTALDQVVTSIQKLGARPMLVLSYSPPWLATTPDQPPTNWQEWEKLVTATIRRYSGPPFNIANIYYEVWNEPDLFGNWHYAGQPNYLKLYYHTAKPATRLRSRVRAFKIGGPATTGFYPNWITALTRFCAKANLPLDFISWHRYSTNLADYRADFEKLNRILTATPQFFTAERLITEFGPRPEAKNSLYQTTAAAAHLIAVVTATHGRLHRIFSFEPVGRWPIIATPRERVFPFLANVSGTRLQVTGEGSWVRALAWKNKTGYHLLLVNWDPAGRHREYVPVTFVNLTPGRWQLTLTPLFGQRKKQTITLTSTRWRRFVPLSANQAIILSLQPQSKTKGATKK